MDFGCFYCGWKGKAKVVCERAIDNSINGRRGWFIAQYVECPSCGNIEEVSPYLVPDIIIELTRKEWDRRMYPLPFFCIEINDTFVRNRPNSND